MSARDELFAEMGEHLTRDDRNQLIDAALIENRAETLHEAADAVAEYTDNPQDANAKMLRRMAEEVKK